MQEAFFKLWSTGNFDQTVALLILLGLSFLLGLLLWALLAHLPSARKHKKRISKLEENNKLIKKDYTDVSERYKVVNAKYNRLSSDLQNAEAKLKEKVQKTIDQQENIKMISSQLELYKDHARNFKESKEKLMIEFQRLSEVNKKLKIKTDGLKNIVEDIEAEKVDLLIEKQESIDAGIELNKQIKVISEKMTESEKQISMLKTDLEEAMTKKAKYKKMVFELEASEELEGVGDQELKNQLVDLKSHINDLEQESSDLMKRLAPFLEKESSLLLKEREIDEMMDITLSEVADNMEKDGFYVDYLEDDLIEDKNYLEKALTEESVQESPDNNKFELISFDEEEEIVLDDALVMSSEALNREGFYADIDKASLVESMDIPGDTLTETKLKEINNIMKDSLFFNEKALEKGFIDDEKKLTAELKKITTVEQAEELSEAPVQIIDSEHDEMDAALESSNKAMSVSSLYSPSETKKPLSSSVIDDKTEQPSSELESAVMQEIGRSVPQALEEDKDDLKKIDGIGQFLEQKLNQFGIYTYNQISQFDENFIDKLGAALGFSEKTILRDKWVEQAGILLN